MRKVTVLIPCHNEEAGIANVIKGFSRRQLRRYGFALDVLVIDNNSTDKTAAVAKKAGARVIHEAKKGKGNAIRAGFAHLLPDTDYVAMLDGDDTYRPQELLRLLEPLESGFSNVVIGSRMHGRINEGSMAPLNRLGNRVFSRLVRSVYGVSVTDVLTGYFAWTRGAVERLQPHLVSDGFAIEMEMITKMARLGEEIYSVPITYLARAGESNLRPLQDGGRILKMFMRNLQWRPQTARRQRIAFVSDAVLPYHKGGKEKRLFEIATRLVAENREVHIYTMQWWDGPKIIVHEGVHYHAICKLHPLYRHNRRSMREALWFGLATFKLLFVRFDVLDVDQMPFFPLFSAKIVTLLRRRRLYASWHEVTDLAAWQAYVGVLGGVIAWMVERLATLLPDVIIANSVHTERKLHLLGRRNVKTVQLGVDLAHIYTVAPAATPNDVIFVGRLLAHKNADALIKAIAIIKTTKPDIRCLIVGGGPERTALETLVVQLGVQANVEFTGEVATHSEVYALMKASKMLVLPSVREGFGLVAVEANAAGIPVITTAHQDNATRDLIQEGVNGLLVEPYGEAIAAKIKELLAEMSTFSPSSEVAQYDWQVVASNIERSYGL